VIASISPRDQYHSSARKLDGELRSGRTRIVTTTGVLLEIGNSLAKARTRFNGGRAIESLLADPSVEVVQVIDLLARALQL
jgi:hypothetical protein